jgi:hypothetical protein
LVRLRKLLIKLVAIETALVGWLSYWLFLVYVNNPPIAAELFSSLQRFPQLSFSTIDIAVMVIIAALSVTLAFKFQRGLRPGIRLERALQMLENLMKRNLVLEAQVAELKIEKSHTPPQIASAPASSSTTPEPRPGSWEKVFRTPLEAGPPISSKAGAVNDETAFARETGIPPPRIEPKPQASPSVMKTPILVSDKGTGISSPPPNITPDKPIDKPGYPSPPKSSSSNWEDSPQLLSETRGILTSSTSTRKVPAISDSGGLRSPYIPAPAPRPAPQSVPLGPTTSPTSTSQSSPKITLSPPPRITARPTSRTTAPKIALASPTPATIEGPKPENALPATVPPPPILLPPPNPRKEDMTSTVNESSIPKHGDATEASDEKTSSKPVQPTRKKLSLDGN